MDVSRVRFARTPTALFFVGLLASIASGSTLTALGAPESLSGVVAGALLPLPMVIGEAIGNRQQHGAPPESAEADGYVLPTVLAVTIALGTLVAFRSAVDAVVSGFAVGFYVEGGNFDLDPAAVQLGYMWLAVLPVCGGTYLLLRWVARRLRSREHLWVAAIIMVSATVQAVWMATSGIPLLRELLVIHAVTMLCQLGLGLVAAETGRRSRISFAAASRVRRLAPDDQAAILRRVLDTVETGDQATAPDGEHGSTARRPQPFGDNLAGIGLGILLSVAVSVALLASGVPETFATLLGGAAGLVPSTLVLARAGSHAGLHSDVRALIDGRPTRPVTLSVFVAVLALLTLKNAILLVSAYATVGWVLYLRIPEETGTLVLQWRYFLVAVPLFWVFGHGVLRAVARRLGRWALRGTLLAVGVAAALHLAGAVLVGGEVNLWTALELVEFLVLAVLAVVAVRGARRTAVPFALRRLVRLLAPHEAADVNGLLRKAVMGTDAPRTRGARPRTPRAPARVPPGPRP